MKNSSLFLKIIYSGFLSCLCSLLFGQDKNLDDNRDSLVSFPLSEAVITASRVATFQLNTPEAIGVIKNSTIQRYQLRTGPEALFIMPGIFVQKTNHGGGSPFLRGLTGNQTLLLIDGIRLSNATTRYGPNQYFNTLDIFSLDKIEVLRGSGSVQYGSDAMGGTVQAFSEKIGFSDKPIWGGSVLSRLATQGMEQSLHSGLHYSNKVSAFRGGISWRNFGDVVGGDTTGRQSPSGYRELDFDLKGMVKLTPSSVLTLAYQNVHQTNVHVYHKIALENYAVNKMNPQNRKLGYIRLNHDMNHGIWENAVFTASMQHTEEGRESRKNGSDILRSETDQVRSLGFSAEANTSGGNIWSANSGLEIYNDRVASTRDDRNLMNRVTIFSRGLYPDGSTMTSMALYTLQRIELPSWIFTTGIRFNSFIIKVKDEDVGVTKLSPSALVGNFSMMRKLNSASNLFFSVNSGFRAPNIDDLGALGIVDFRYEIPNLNLKPESSVQYQLGYKYKGAHIQGEIYLYRNELYNLIVRSRVEGGILEGYPVYRKENVEHAYIQGIESSWGFRLTSSWLLTGNITYTYGQNVTKNEPVRRIPPLFGLAALEYRSENWWTCLEWRAAGKQNRLAQGDIDDNRIPDNGTPGWNIVNIHAGYSVHFIQMSLSIQNILNKDYRYHGSGMNGYGRTAFLTVKFEI